MILFYIRAWGIINLPVGNYSLLFRVDTDTSLTYSFALDNIDITSCDYPPSSVSYNSLISFSCNFDNLTMCDMINDEKNSTFNFTIFTGDTIPYQELGPVRDHTINSTSADFLYWNQDLLVNTSNRGRVYLSKTIEQNTGMCIKFAYYVKSKLVNKNTTVIRLSSNGCSSTGLWYRSLDDSRGWQIALVPLSKVASAITFYFDVYRLEPTLTAIAFDDIEIDQCSSFISTTTSTSTTIITTSTISTSTLTTTLRNNASQLFSLNAYSLIIHYVLFQSFRQFF
ncbi:unnamed protein product [Rotaria sp. Silwood2]|nr:unnamed protein product [Rotaria sp. Silwood2]